MPYETKYYARITIELWERSGELGRSLFSRRAHLLTTSSAQAPYPSPRRKAAGLTHFAVPPLPTKRAIYKARKEIRPEKEDEIKDRLWDEYSPDYSLFLLADSTRQARKLLDEEAEERWLERELRRQENEQKRKEHPTAKNRKKDDWER